MQSNLPIDYLQNMSPSIFVAKYSLLGYIFQPDLAKQVVVSSLIK
jgi:hypothetical protein